MVQWTVEQWAATRPKVVTAFDTSMRSIERDVSRKANPTGDKIIRDTFSVAVALKARNMTVDQWAIAQSRIAEWFEATLSVIDSEISRDGKSHGVNVSQDDFLLSVLPQ